MKRYFGILIFICFYNISNAGLHYVAPSGGSDSNPGTINSPWLTWQYAFDHTSPDDTCYFRGGVYYYTSSSTLQVNYSGTEGHLICFFNYPGEIPILDLTNKPEVAWNYALGVAQDYLHFKGLQIRNVLQYPPYSYAAGIIFDLADHVIFENITVHDCGGAGFISQSGPGEITFINCDSYDNFDSMSNYEVGGVPYVGGGATGFTLGSDNANSYFYLIGCRAWNNSDGGFSWSNAGVMLLENCWAFSNGYEQGDGNGFKGYHYGETIYSTIRKTIRNSIAADNSTGFDQNGDPERYGLYNNFAYHNGHTRIGQVARPTGFFFYTHDVPHTYRNNISYDNYDPINYIAYNGFQSNNSWNSSNDPGLAYEPYLNPTITITNGDFVSLDISQLSTARKVDGSLPDITFGHLVAGSDLIDAGTNVGMSATPDIGIDWAYLGLESLATGRALMILGNNRFAKTTRGNMLKNK